MRLLCLFFLLFSARLYAQAVQQPVGDERVRYAIGQTIRESIRTNYPAASDSAIDKTMQRVGEVMGNAANNPQYQVNATRWAWIGFRLIQRSNPLISIALELCSWQGLCVPNKKLDVRQVNDGDAITTQYIYELPYPTLPTGLIYFAGKSIPASSFTCGGTDAFIENFENYWPGLGDPCRVQAAFPSAINAHQIYLSKYGKDYFDIEKPQDFDYSEYYLNTTVPQIIATPAIICRDFATGSGTYYEKFHNPYWPCISTPLLQSSIDSLLIYNGGPPIPYTWSATVKTTDGDNIKIVTDFPMTDLQLYPDAPSKGRIDLYPWLQSLTATDLASAVSPAWIEKVATAAWLQANQSPNYDGLPYPSTGISSANLQSALDTLGSEWPTIGDIIDPIENNQIDPYYSRGNNPRPKTYVFNWTCGFSNYPACIFDFLFNYLSSTVENVSLNFDPYSNISVSEIDPKSGFLAFIKTRLAGQSCTLVPKTVSVSGKPLTVNWDFCKFAYVARDVLAIMSYVITAGFLIGGLTRR